MRSRYIRMPSALALVVRTALAVCGGMGCGHSADPCLTERPAWATVDAGTRRREWLGEACGVPRAQAERAAVADALSDLAQELGVKICSETLVVQRQGADGASADVRATILARGMPITVHGARVRSSHVAGSASHAAAWVLLQLPDAEYERLVRMTYGRTTLLLRCLDSSREGAEPTGNPAGACPPAVVAEVREAASGAGLTLAPETLGGGGPEDAASRGSAYLLRVDIRTRHGSATDGEHFAYGSAAVEWQDASLQKSLFAGAVTGEQETKGGAYTERGAVDAARTLVLRKVRELLASGLGGKSRGQELVCPRAAPAPESE